MYLFSTKNRVLIFVVMLLAVATLVFPKSLLAQVPVLNPIESQSLHTTGRSAAAILQAKRKEAFDKKKAEVRAKIERSGGYAVGKALTNALNFYLSRLAYDAASDLAGAKQDGYEPRLFTANWRDYLENTGKDAFGEFMGTLDREKWRPEILGKKLRLNICAPDLKIRFNILLQLFHEVEPRPKCTWNQIRAAGTAFWDRWTGPQSQQTALSLVGFQLQPGQTDLSATLAINDKIMADSREERENKKAERLEGRGFRGVLSPITKNVKTPAAVIEDRTNFESRHAADGVKASVSDIFFNKEMAWALGANVASMFANTLLEKTAQRIIEGLVPDIPTPEPSLPYPGELVDSQSQPVTINANIAYGDLLRPPITELTNYNPLNDFVTCNPTFRGANHCVLDQKFALAVGAASAGKPLTVNQAIQNGYLNVNWPLISSNDSRNIDPLCHTYGYCESNLKKLRQTRIIPIGWEIAASKSPVEKPVSLGEAIAGFRDPQSPWYKLIDPNWVLKLPLTQCRAMVYGATRVSVESPDREQVCVDAPTCIEEDEKGNCIGGYGYCSREKNVWKLGGDICPAQDASCLTLQPRQGKAVNYLLNTVNYSVCTAENVGCKGYSLTQAADSSWPVTPAVYLDKDAPACDSKDAGCTELVSKKFGVALNLLPNGSFEKHFATSTRPDDWDFKKISTNWLGIANSDASNSGFYNGSWPGNSFSSSFFNNFYGGTWNNFIGDQSVRLAAKNTSPLDGEFKALALKNPVNLSPNNVYSISLYARTEIANTITNTDNPAKLFLTLSPSSGLTFFNTATNCEISANGLSIILPIQARDVYERTSCAFTTPLTLTPSISAALRIISDPAVSILIDAIQLEEGGAATPFLEAGYGSVQKAYLKVAPDYLNCALDDARAECQKYAPVCLPEEVGCELYTPTDGDPAVPGIVGSGDRCPAECVGYATFKQEPTNFEVASFPLYFIPKTGQACNAKAVGCDEFTNLEAVTAGGENREYFSSVRLCQKPASDSATFYTWEGSDTVGYQLKSWNLKKSDQNDGPCTRLNPTNPNQCADDGIVGVCAAAELATNPDCREFYDQAGNIYRRLYSKTIVSSADCKPFRKTDSNQTNCQATGGAWNATAGTCVYNIYRPESGQCAAAEAGCRAYTGNAGKNIFTVFNDTFSDKTAGAWQGGAPSSESLKVGDSSLTSKTNLLVRDLTKTPAQVGKTYLLEFWAKGISKAGGLKIKLGGTNLSEAYFAGVSGKPKVDLGAEWQEYRLGPLEVSQENMIDDQLLAISNFNLIFIDNIVLREVSDNIYLIKNSWSTPASCDQTQDGTPLPQAMLGCEEYKDRANTSNYLKSFDRLCREKAVGCEAFINTYNSAAVDAETYNVHRQMAVTCTNNAGCSLASICTVAKGATTCTYNVIGAGPTEICESGVASSACRGLDTVTIPKDHNVYLVNDSKFACTQEVAGCSALGEHKINQVCTLDSVCTNNNGCNCTEDGASCTILKNERSCSFKRPPGSVETKHLLNQPDKYAETLCKVEAEGCEAYTYAPSGQIYYFKTPQEQLCEFQEALVASPGASPQRGWFKKGTTDPCGYIDLPPVGGERTPYLVGGTQFGIWKNADGAGKYEGYVGECPAQFSACTEFKDPTDINPVLYPDGRPYYYLKNEKINSGDCAGSVNPKDGCILLHDNSDPALLYNAAATYKSSSDSGDIKVAPVNCDLNSTVCTVAGFTKNDSNLLVKAKVDRVCTDWLACKTSTLVFDPRTGTSREICLEYGRCIEYAQTSGGSVCLRFGSPEAAKILTEQIYTGRKTTFGSEDYSGFSIPEVYPVSAFTRDGNELRISKVKNTAIKVSSACRAYPEPDSPFPSHLAEFDKSDNIISRDQGWEDVNICGSDNKNPKNCQCDYLKTAYGNPESHYTDFNRAELPPGLCNGGRRHGQVCIPGATFEQSPDLSCGPSGEAGTCNSLEKVDRFIGLQGFCIERDKSVTINGLSNQYNCLSWYPSDILLGGRDLYNYFEKAGFSAFYTDAGGRFYCAESEGRGGFAASEEAFCRLTGEPCVHDTYNVEGNCEPMPSQSNRCINAKSKHSLDFCAKLVDVGAPSETIYAKTSVLARNYAIDPITDPDDSSQYFNLNYKYLHNVPPYGSAKPRWFTPLDTPDIYWATYFGNKQCNIGFTCALVNGCPCYKYSEASCVVWSSPITSTTQCALSHNDTCTLEEGTTCPVGSYCPCNTSPKSILECTVPQGANSCEFGELIYSGLPWSCTNDFYIDNDNGFCGRVLEPSGNIESFDIDPTRTGGASKYWLSQVPTTFGQVFAYVRRVFRPTYEDVLNCQPAPSDPYDYNGGASLCINTILDQSESPPTIKAVKNSKLIAHPSKISGTGITVNGFFESDSIVISRSGTLDANIQFAFYTLNHGPIIGMKIDWGDGGNIFETKESKYKNKVPPYVASDGTVSAGCDLDGFAGTPDACDPQPAQFKHVYIYDKDDSTHCDFTDSHIGISAGTKHCHFKPKVQVIDNWGYCNGECPGGQDAAGLATDPKRCFDAPKDIFDNTAEQECSDPGTGDTPWTEFKGTIIVAP